MAISTTGAIIGMGAMSAVGAYSSAASANAQADAQVEAAQRKYRLESGIAEQQMDEQQTIAMEEMTEVSREFIKAKSQQQVMQAESGTSGVTAERMASVINTKESEAKGKIAKEVDTNVINIAQGMLASKIEAENAIAEANASRRSVVFDTIVGGISGGLQGYSLGRSLELDGITKSLSGNNINSPYKPTTSANYGTTSGNWIGV